MAGSPAPDLKKVLEDFVEQLKIPEDEQKRSEEVVREVVEKNFIQCMKKEDSMFNELYRDIYYTGSYYEGLKVHEANEFDLDIILDMPFSEDEVQIIHEGVPPGFVKYRVIQDEPCYILCRHPAWTIKNIMDDDYLSSVKLNNWLQSIVDKVLINNREKFPDVTRSYRGPAKTLTIKSSKGAPELDVDLVPVVQLATYPGSVRDTKLLKDIPEESKICFIVPKPPTKKKKKKCKTCNHERCAKRKQQPSDTLFRVSIPEAEKLLMKDKGCVKDLIKIFKAIRDFEMWKYLCSYYIKTAFFWELEVKPDAKDWEQDKLDKLFIQMLRTFISIIEKKCLCHIFFEDYNFMSDALSDDTFKNWGDRFRKFLKWSYNDVPRLRQYFKKSQTKLASIPNEFQICRSWS